MNFFEHQDRARTQTKLLVFAFALAVVAIVLAMNLVMLAVFGQFQSAEPGWLSASFWRHNREVVLWTSVITVGLVAVAALYRSAQLGGGGARVAHELGGVPVDGSTTDPLKRRLLNVVEEMAIASGVPVPEVFVLEQESGINAFAAGWSPSDAAVAVTRGTLETLSREELQGVIAHEFSHVFNGDMRLNIRLMGVLFGILVLAIAGRRMLSSMRYSVGRNRKGGGIVLVALAVMLTGYIGLFFGRWIQAAVSRQREYLADASAVQFTRSPAGIAGALKKIGAADAGSALEVNTDEVGHMLFASGLAQRLFATHPPLEARIRKIEPSFRAAQFADVARRMQRERQARLAEQEQAEFAAPSGAAAGATLDPAGILDRIGQPDVAGAAIAAAMLAGMPGPLQRAAHSDERAADAVLYLLVSDDEQVREQQLLDIARERGAESEQRVRELHAAEPALDPALRLPLLELAFPALRRRPEAELVGLMRLSERLIAADGEIDVFEYALARLLNREIEDALNPPRGPAGGRKRLLQCADEVVELVEVLAWHGHSGDADAAAAAARAALGPVDGISLPDNHGPAHFAQLATSWRERLDTALARLDGLRLAGRESLIEILLRCATADERIVPAEYELLRAVAGLLRVPLPLAASGPAGGG